MAYFLAVFMALPKMSFNQRLYLSPVSPPHIKWQLCLHTRCLIALTEQGQGSHEMTVRFPSQGCSYYLQTRLTKVLMLQWKLAFDICKDHMYLFIGQNGAFELEALAVPNLGHIGSFNFRLVEWPGLICLVCISQQQAFLPAH